MAAHAQGVTRLLNLLDSDDTRVMRRALTVLGIEVRDVGAEVLVKGEVLPPVKAASLDVGNSGLSVRSLVPALAFTGGQYFISGVPRMHARPIGPLVDALSSIGASIGYLEDEGFPPLMIAPHLAEPGGTVSVAGNASSQFVTGLIQAAPIWLSGRAADRDIVIKVVGELISRQYVALTLDMMARFGVSVQGSPHDASPAFVVPANARYQSPGELLIEGDASSASYFLALGALAGGPVVVEGVSSDSAQPDIGMLAVLEQMGATVTRGKDAITVTSPGVSSGFLLGAIDADLNHMPDAAMTVAALCMFANGPSCIRNIGSWRVKETDRLAAMATELTRFGATVTEGPDWLGITPPRVWSQARVQTYDDHRMAMSAALLACSGVAVTIENPACVNKTFPDFFERLDALVVR
jgi:3-phosphoshikimate 1-carboxyvinyltransferase